MEINFSNWAVVGFKDQTGLGRMAQDARSVLGVGRHVVIPSERLDSCGPLEKGEVGLNADASVDEVEAAIRGIDGLLLLERINWSKNLVTVAKRLGIRVALVPMWEWFRGELPGLAEVDLFVCPHRFAEEIVQSYGWRQTVTLPWVLDMKQLPRRVVNGPARLFIHNAGLVDFDDRKGTRDTIKAFMKVRRKDIRLVVRMQKEAALPWFDGRVEVKVGNCSDPASLYVEGDVAIQPSKMEGLGFMALEAVCAGLPVITTDYPPMNEWVRDPEMRCKLRWFRRKAFPTQWVRHAHLRLPNPRDLVRRLEWCAENDLSRYSEGNRRWAEEVFAQDALRRLWVTTFSRHLKAGANGAK